MSVQAAAQETNEPDIATDISTTRVCQVNSDQNGKPLGLTLFLSSEDLQGLGVDPQENEVVSYGVENGELVFSETYKALRLSDKLLLL